MAIHEDYQKWMFDELISVMPTKDMDLTTEILSKLKFMDACIRETMRLFPTVTLIGRTAVEPIVLNNAEIPAGLPIMVGIRQIHRRTDYWGNDAHLFRPERFLSDAANYKDNPGCYLPFSMGPRNCIGKIHLLNQQFEVGFKQVFFSLWLTQVTATHCTQLNWEWRISFVIII